MKNIAVVLVVLSSATAANGQLPTVGFQVEAYAEVVDANKFAIASDGTIYTGRDNSGSGGGNADAVKIHRIGVGGSPVTEFGEIAIPDPDVVAVDRAGLLSGTPGTVLVGGNSVGQIGPVGGSLITAISQSGAVSQLIHVPGQTGQDVNAMAFDSAGRLLFSTDVGVYVATDTTPTVFASLGGVRPGDIAIDSSDNVFIRGEDNLVRKYDSSGSLLAEPFSTMGDIAYSDGQLFARGIYTIEEDELRFITDSGAKLILGTGFGFGPTSLEFAPDGSLFVSQFDQDRILSISASRVPEPSAIALMLSAVVAAWMVTGRRPRASSM